MAYTFKEVPEQEITPLLESHPDGSFAQSVAMAKVRADSGRDTRYIVIKNGAKIVAGAQLSIISGRFKSADITGGPLLDFSNKKLVDFFTTSIREHLQNQASDYLTLSPTIPYNKDLLAHLKKRGWHYSGRINAHASGIRGGIRWIYVKDLTGLTLDTYRDAYAKRHRRYIKNHDPRLSIRALNRDELPLFIDIMRQTAERRQFINRKDDYFYSLYDNFGDAAHFMVVELDKKTPVAGIVFLETNGEIVSFLGGAISEYANYRGTYLLHDAMIRRAVEKCYARYNFYGIEGKIDDPSSEGYGIYQFKARFGTGEAIELLGELVLPINPWKYRLFTFLRRVL